MHGITCHAEAALPRAAVELSAAAIAERMLPPRGHLSSDAWQLTRQVMHGITCHAEAAPSSADGELSRHFIPC